MTDTSPEAVEREASRLEREATYDGDWRWKTAAMLRALAAKLAEVEAERDALRIERKL